MLVMLEIIARTFSAQCLPGNTAGDDGDGVEVSVGYQVSQHPQEVADTGRVDVGLVEIGVDEVRQTNKSVEEVTERQVKDQDN